MSSSPPSEWQYVAAAYLVVFVVVLTWVALIAAKLERLQKQLGELVEKARDAWLRRCSGRRCSATARRPSPTPRRARRGRRPGACASAGSRRRRCSPSRPTRADGFPWSSWAGSLNLFVWFVVGAYLIWGCRPRFRLLGLAVMPLAAALFLVARIGGGTGAGAKSGYGNLFLVLHVGFVLAAFAGFTLAAALAGLYLWEERRLKRRAADILRLRLPPLASLERLTWRTIAVSLPLLTLGLAAGIVRQRQRGSSVDALEAVTLVTWLVYGGFLVAAADRSPRRVPRARRLRARDRRAARARREPLRMTLTLVGLSHHVAPVELRERVTVDLDGAATLARSLGDAVCLSTCNRTELYVDGIDEGAVLAALEQLAGESLDGVVYRLHEDAAALHLFRVAAGLDSLVPGEGEILGQVRAAYESVAAGAAARPRLPAGARRRQARPHRDGDRREPRVGLVGGRGARGAGVRRPDRTPRAADRRRADRRARGVEPRVARRRDRLRREPHPRDGARARAPLRRAGADARRDRGAARRGRRRGLVDQRAGPVLHASDVPAKRRTPLFFIDIAVPRDLDSDIARLDGCFLYDIDDLEAVVAETLAGRRAEAERAEELVAEEAERFRAWRASLDVVPAIASLRARAEEIRNAELAKLKGRVSDDERRTIESVTSQILNKLLHLPTIRMKEAAVSADGAAYADAVRHLFGLEDEAKP